MFSLEELHLIERLQAPLIIALYWMMYRAELFRPLRSHGFSRTQYRQNLLINAVNFIFIGMFSHLVVTYSYAAMHKGWGLYSLVGLTGSAMIAVQIVIYDLLSYSIHRLFHSHDRLWSLHRCHHSDGKMNASTGFRFHPGEGLIRLTVQAGFIIVTGMSPYAIIVHGLIAAPLFLLSHANLALPKRLERVLARVLVLPRDHSVHHHPERNYHDSNYGTIFMFWDHLFGTYTSPEQVSGLPVGLYGYDQDESLIEMLADPLSDKQKTPASPITPSLAPRQ